MFTTGFMIFAGVGLLLAKLKRRTMLKVLRHDLALDLAITALVLWLHWGTLTGVMGATIAGLLTSLATSSLKKWIGFIEGNTYYPGRIQLEV